MFWPIQFSSSRLIDKINLWSDIKNVHRVIISSNTFSRPISITSALMSPTNFIFFEITISLVDERASKLSKYEFKRLSAGWIAENIENSGLIFEQADKKSSTFGARFENF
jgi:hypothetical protein